VSWRYYLNRCLWSGIDWLYPPLCGGCNQAGFRWCPNCQTQRTPIPEPTCALYSIPLSRPGLCLACRTAKPPYQFLRSWAVFEGPVRNALHRLKYRRNLGLGEALAWQLADYATNLGWPIDLVVPVPLGKKRLQERGYNQVALMAMPLAAMRGWAYDSHCLFRARETKSQVGLSANERKENMRGAFRAEPRAVKGRNVLLVDDVATTGATLSSSAEALQDAGAQTVYALTLARALPRHGLQIV
jgi:ComF family protein